VENNKYGWFWHCPNGNDKCIYKHALPPGFVLKKDKKKAAEKTDTVSLEELIEEKRSELSKRTDLTKVTLETFLMWKKRKLKEKADLAKKDNKDKREKYMAGLRVGMSGREMFLFDPKMVADEVCNFFLIFTNMYCYHAVALKMQTAKVFSYLKTQLNTELSKILFRFTGR
jgi:hypothetical protein